jgi:L-ascorbate metabolism protein UlaG (beta-lactamase superfamily)
MKTIIRSLMILFLLTTMAYTSEDTKQKSVDTEKGSGKTKEKRVFSSDRFKTTKGDLLITPIQNATLVIQWNNNTIYVDPVWEKEFFNSSSSPDVILVTHSHHDHLNIDTINAVKTEKTKFVVSTSVAKGLSEIDQISKTVLKNGDKFELLGITIEAIPMYNLTEGRKWRHQKGDGNGYVLTLGGTRVYISGDTEDITEMRQLKDIDIAFVCMNLPYTMTVEQAVSAVLDFKPKIIYPYHYRGYEGMSDLELFKKLVSKDKNIEVRLCDWYKYLEDFADERY